jgi:hypothetical protein
MIDTRVIMFGDGNITVRGQLNHKEIAGELAAQGYHSTLRVYVGYQSPYTLMKAGVVALYPEAQQPTGG